MSAVGSWPDGGIDAARPTPRPGTAPGDWGENDYDVLDDGRCVGRIYRVTDYPGSPWFWGLGFEAQLSSRKRYGDADTLDDAKAAFKAEYELWQSEQSSKPA